MKRIITLFLLIGIYQVSHAQFKTIAEGPEFPEYREGYAKVLQLKNGNTILLHFSIKDGIDVQLYDASHKRILDKNILPSYGKLRGGDFDAIFESQGNAVVILSERTERHPILRRLIFDGKTGKLKKEEVLLDLDKEKRRGKRYTSGSSSDFNVVKDPYSECYAVFTDKNGEGQEVIHYGADHSIINRADLPAPSDKRFDMYYEDMVVNGDQGVYVLLSEVDGDKSELQLGTLEKGSKSITVSSLPFPKDEIGEGGLIKHNPHTKQLLMLQYVKRKVKRDSKYFTFFTTYDLTTKTSAKAKEISLNTADAKTKEIFGKKRTYEGEPQNLYIRQDGSFTVVFEENEIEYSGSRNQFTSTIFGNLAVMDFDKNGTEKNCWIIPRNTFVASMLFYPFYHKKRENTAEWCEMGNQFRFFNFVSGPAHDYIMINDRPDNQKAVEDGKVKRLAGVGDAYGYHYKLGGKDMFPKRELVFTSPDAEKSNNLGIFIIADNGTGNNSYATIRVSPQGSKKARVVWMTPE